MYGVSTLATYVFQFAFVAAWCSVANTGSDRPRPESIDTAPSAATCSCLPVFP